MPMCVKRWRPCGLAAIAKNLTGARRICSPQRLKISGVQADLLHKILGALWICSPAPPKRHWRPSGINAVKAHVPHKSASPPQ